MIFGAARDDIDVTASALAVEFGATAAEYDRTAAFPFENIRRLGETGLAALVVPCEFGGRGSVLRVRTAL
jgi:alkylation response protein AidB-like acyl-CoA dehydrogenase